MSNILPKGSSQVSYTQKLIVSKKFDNFSKITLRVTETGPSRIHVEALNLKKNLGRELQHLQLQCVRQCM